MGEEIITLNDVTKSFSGVKVIDNLSFSVSKGEIIGVLGPNGSGKTTTIRLINGVIYPDCGRMRLAGYDPVTAGDEVRKRCGVLTESAGLYQQMTALDNLLFFADLYGVEDPKRRAEKLLSDFGLAEHQLKKVSIYSTGMRKRLGIAKALLHHPEVLFLDEPTTGLDPEGARDLITYIKDLNQKYQVTVFIATHLLKQVQDLCHRFVFLHQGRVLESGTLAELEEKYLQEVIVRIETELSVTESKFSGYRVEGREPGYIRFRVKSKEEIPLLLKEILALAPVYSLEISGRDLESLYFRIRGEER